MLERVLGDDWPTPADVAQYEALGSIVAPDIVPPALLDEARLAIEAYYLGERDHALPCAGFLDWRPEHGEALRLNDYVSLQSDALRALATWTPIAAAASRLMRSPVVRLFHDQLITKPPHEAGIVTTVGWHTDRAYWATCTSTRMVTAWIPLDDCPVEAGPLAVVDGSHRWDGTEWMSTFTEIDLTAIEARLGRSIVGRPQAMRRGQVSFHHASTIHGSFPNRTSVPRTALAVHFQDGDNQYRAAIHPGTGRPAVHMNDALCRRRPDGTPDYADPGICPVLWPV